MSKSYINEENLRIALENILECFATTEVSSGWELVDKDGEWQTVSEDLEAALCRAEDLLNRLDEDEEEEESDE
jgi:hypothetical protein